MWPLLLVLAVGAVSLTVWAYRQTWPNPSAKLGRVLVTLRSTALVLLVLAVGGPVISTIRNVEERPDLVFVFEDSASMAIPDAGEVALDMTDGPEAENRWARAQDLASRVDSSLAVIQPDFQTVFLRGNGVRSLGEFSREDLEIDAPIAQGTDLGRLLRQVRDYAAGRPARAIVLFSDGQETVGQGLFSTDSRMGQRISSGVRGGGSAPLIAVGVGDPRGPADRVLKDLRYPGTAYQGDEVVVELAVDHRFTGALSLPPVTARLHGPDGVIAEITAPIVGDVTPLELVFRPKSVGPQVYHLEISALENERFLENNEVSLAIDVRQERARLLLLCDRPNWDVRFLAQAAAREQRLAVSMVYSHSSGLVYADSLVPWHEPATVEEWAEWDGVILMGWGGRLAELDWARLASATEGGLGLLVLPENPQGIRAAPLTRASAALLDLLPVEARSGRWMPGSYSLQAGNRALGHSILEGLIDPGGSAPGTVGLGLNELPPLREVILAGPRQGAQVLLSARGKARTGQSTSAIPVLVVSSRGSGRMAWFGGRNLWELAFWESDNPGGVVGREAEQVARRLLRNLLIWTAEGEKERELAFSGRRPSYQEGERIRLSAIWRDLRGQPVTGRKLSLSLSGSAPEGAEVGERTFPLVELTGNPGTAEVVLPPLPPGAYSIQLIGQGNPPVLSRRENLVVTRYSIESTQVRQDPRRLRQLAAGAGDSYVDGHSQEALEEVLDLLNGLDWSGNVRKNRARLDLLSGWPFLAAVTLLLGLEWFLRRRNGML